jgi:hypothetical protein
VQGGHAKGAALDKDKAVAVEQEVVDPGLDAVMNQPEIMELAETAGQARELRKLLNHIG